MNKYNDIDGNNKLPERYFEKEIDTTDNNSKQPVLMEYEKYLNAVPGYLENKSNISKKPFYHTTLKRNLEKEVNIGAKPKKSGFLEKLITDKTKSHKASVKAILQEIELREKLNLHLLNNIDQDISRQNTYMDRLKSIKVQYSIELASNISKTKSKVENNMLELEKEKRKEYLECWRDLMVLKKYLLVSLKDYWNLVKKREALGVDDTLSEA